MTEKPGIKAELTALLRARCTLLWVVTREEVRAERGIIEAAGAARYETLLWDCATGLSDSAGVTLDANLKDPRAMLTRIGTESERAVYVLRDLHRWLDPMVLRSVRSLARDLQSTPRDSARTVVVLTPSTEVPPELAGHAVVVDYPLPERAEIAAILEDVLSTLNPEQAAQAAENGDRDRAIDAAVGLTAEEAANCYARSLVSTRKIDPKTVSDEKRRVIARERVLRDLRTGAIDSARFAFLDEDDGADVEALPAVDRQRFADLDTDPGPDGDGSGSMSAGGPRELDFDPSGGSGYAV